MSRNNRHKDRFKFEPHQELLSGLLIAYPFSERVFMSPVKWFKNYLTVIDSMEGQVIEATG
jgi:hypothetical protein